MCINSCVVLVCVCINSCVSMTVSGMYVHNCGNVGGMSGWRTRGARVRQGDEKSAPLGPPVSRRSSFTLCTSAADCPAPLSLSFPRVARSGKSFFRGFLGTGMNAPRFLFVVVQCLLQKSFRGIGFSAQPETAECGCNLSSRVSDPPS